MKRSRFLSPLGTASVVLSLLLLFSLAAPAAAEIVVPQDFTRIQDAIDAAAATGDTVMVEPGTYQETFTLKDGVDISGRETARTFLDGNGSGPIITVTGSTVSSIKNFTFKNASIGIQVSNNASALVITNNVFEVGANAASIGVSILSSPSTSIENNTFYNNGTAVSTDADIAISNNIFANSQTVAIGGTAATSTKVRYNDFFSNIANGSTGTNSKTCDPLFVDTASHDFHLQEDKQTTPCCIDAGDPNPDFNDIFDITSRNDLGAYGGPFADSRPFPVSGLTFSKTDTSISLSWHPNMCYLVTGQSNTNGANYNLYYGYASGVYDGIDATEASPVPIPVTNNASYTLNIVDPLSRTPDAPVLDPLVPGNGTLKLTWSAVAGATGYNVHYGTLVAGENGPLDAGTETSYTITGLKNGQSYIVAVSATVLPVYYITVTAVDFASNESVTSQEVSAQIGPALESAFSNEQTDYPDAAAPYPALSDSRGRCFIATAAYGSYSAPPVQALRSFRDTCLLTNAPGRLFVQWYYHYGPLAADLLNAHPAYKPAVRVALIPVVGAAIVLTQFPGSIIVFMLLITGTAITLGLLRKKRTGIR